MSFKVELQAKEFHPDKHATAAPEEKVFILFPSQNRTYTKLSFKQALSLVPEGALLGSHFQEKMESKMKEIAAAHSCLSDPDK